MNNPIHETWYVLFDGQSEDGMGSGSFHSRTTDRGIAIKHHKECRLNPYSTGHVDVITNYGSNRMERSDYE